MENCRNKGTNKKTEYLRDDVSEFCIYSTDNKKNGCTGDKCRRPYFNSQEQSGIQQTKGSHTPATVEKKGKKIKALYASIFLDQHPEEMHFLRHKHCRQIPQP